MTLGEQRIAIAQAVGWTMLEDRSDGLMMPKGTYVSGYPPVNAIVGIKEELPYYLNDLNAMYEAEKALFPVHVSQLNDPDKWKEYRLCLEHCVIGHPGGTVRATAAQRAEAFLRTLNLWKA